MSAATPHGTSETKHATVNGLAVVGFGALIIGGILLAIYASKYVPDALARLSSAVYLSTDESNTGSEAEGQTPESEGEGQGEEVPFVVTGDEDEAPAEEEAPAAPAKPAAPAPAPASYTPAPRYAAPAPYPVQQTPALYGEPDLAVEILAVGYLANSSPSSFREAREVPEGERAAIRFRVKNVGTNTTSGTWEVEVEYPAARGDETYAIRNTAALAPGGYKDFTFGFDNPDEGDDREFTVTADPDGDIRESDERNNEEQAEIDVERE